MTVRDKLIKCLKAHDDEEVEKIIFGYCERQNRDGDECSDIGCECCFFEYLNKTIKEPMPELKNGMFVLMSRYGVQCCGVVLDDNIILSNGGYIETKAALSGGFITQIFNNSVHCFNSIIRHTAAPLWERGEI